MKCIKMIFVNKPKTSSNEPVYKRVADDLAEIEVKAGLAVYVPKSEFKSVSRPTLVSVKV